MKIKVSNKTLFIILFILFIYTLIFPLITRSDFFYHPSPDVTLSNSYLCRSGDGGCSVIEDNIFVSSDFNKISFCSLYSSSQKTSLEIYLVYEVKGPFIGMFFDDLDKGEFEICYSLKDIVDSLDDSNLGGKYDSPVHNGIMEGGEYRIVIEQARETLVEMSFEVTSVD